MSDTKKRHRGEESTTQSEQEFGLLANTAPVMIWASGPDKKPTYFNQCWLDFTGLTETDLKAGLSAIVHPEDYSRCHDIYSRGFDQRLPFTKQCRLRRHDGEYRWVLDTGVPQFHPDGSFAGYLGSCIDVTDQQFATQTQSSMNRKLVDAQEQERARIARELHDDISQRLAMLSFELEQLQSNPSEIEPLVRGLRKQVSDISARVQAMAHDLHPARLEYLGMVPGMRSWSKEFALRHNLDLEFTAHVRSTVPSEIGVTLFRVLQEALQNVVKHSGTKRVHVHMGEDSEAFQLNVTDQGRGFDAGAELPGKGLGLTSMRERMRLVNGEFEIASKTNGGTEIRARVPFRGR